MPTLTVPELMQLWLAIGCLLLLAKAMGTLAGRIGAPAVLGEILLGILIGPTLLGTLCPQWSTWLFPVEGEAGHVMRQLSGLAVILLLFVAGMEINLKSLSSLRGKVATTVMGSCLFPFAAGFVLVVLNPVLFGVSPERHGLLASFIGIALAISALPVIIRILMDLELYRSRVGVISVAAASVMDLLGWIAFAIVLNCLHPFSMHDAAGMFWSHSTLLGFIAGIVVGNSPLMHEKAGKLVSKFVVPVLSPLFFLSIGIKVNFVVHLVPMLVLAVIATATFSKLIGTYLGGRFGGLGGKEALAVGFALNARGAMEIILSKQALEAGLIQPSLFVALVVMALFTSMLSAPALRLLLMKPQGEKKGWLPTPEPSYLIMLSSNGKSSSPWAARVAGR